ncbi:UNVERIFIED_CONTAM: hypothetical protein K2H54_049138 [Gekko kuhli]
MLLTSFYASSLVVSWGILELGPKYLKNYRKDIPLWAVKGFAWVFGTIVLKWLMCLILGISDDAHISNLLKAKLIGYKDFDTSMYTCALEFDFMEKETPVRYMKTMLLPVVLAIFLVISLKTYQYVLAILCNEEYTERQEDHFIRGELFGWVFRKIQPGTLVVAFLAMMAFEGIANVQKEWSIVGEFSNLPQEELLMWIKANTKEDAVFAGAMPTMASVKLSTLRPIVNHPHYEDAGLRARTKIVYSMYSRKPAKEVKKKLLSLGINYYILEDSWCLRRTKKFTDLSA